MRLGLVVILLAACSSAPPSGPAWPKLSPRTVDGGESLAPQTGARAIATVVEEDKPADRDADQPAAAGATTGADAADKAATGPAAIDPATTISEEEMMMAEEIVIEIDGD